MESDEDNNGFEIDSSPGALVWVRRRNGSWWPGRVLGIDELPEICLNMPRSGTPIKLLGKEDGSIDWYNLEKSKRVKPFRCGEYDECIKKAKEHSLCSYRKSVVNKGKYVRREDAIVHALELEEAHSLDGIHYFGYGSTSSTVISDKSFGLQSNITRKNEESAGVAKKSSKHKNSSQKLSQSGIPLVHCCKLSASKRWKTPNDSQDDATKGMKRMRDLQDLGVGMILKREPIGCALFDTGSHSESDFENGLCNGTPLNSSRDSCSSLKRKVLSVGQANENSKKRCRRRSLSEVWMDATKVKKPSSHQDAISEESSRVVTGIKVIAENSTSKKEESPPTTDDSPDCSGTSCEEALLSTHEINGNAATVSTHFHSKMKDDLFSDILEFVDNDFSGGFIDVPVMASENAQDLPPTLETLPLTKLDSVGEENQSNHCMQVGLVSQLNEGLVEACSASSSSQFNNFGHKSDISASEWHTKGKRNVRHLSLNKILDSESLIDRTNQFETCLLKNKRSSLKETVNNTSAESLTSDSSCQQIKCISVSEIHDVDQKPKLSSVNVVENVKSTVPTQVSLPPRKIRLPSRYRESEENDCCLYDVELNVQSNYQGQRVPLVSLMSKFNGKAIVGHPVTVKILPTNSIKKLHKYRFAWSNKKPSTGKKSGFSPRKIRSLSSFAIDRKEKGLGRKLVVDKIGGPAVSCIPLRLVFSRLNEALNSSS